MAWFSSQWTKLGFAVLRFDKCGAGESTGEYGTVGVSNSLMMIPQLASDIAAGARLLRTRPEIDLRRVGLAGWSLAGWILPHAARELGDAAFVVLFSGPVCSVGLEIYYSDLAEFTTRPLHEVNTLLPQFHGAPGYDPIPVLKELDTPTLWLLGMDDRSIPITVTLANLNALAATGRPFQWRTYDGLGHQLSPVVWKEIGEWLKRLGVEARGGLE